MKVRFNRSAALLPRAAGFSLLELVVTVMIISILAAVAVPSYSTYVSKSRAKGAASDIVSLSLVYENDFQKSLVYPVYPSQTSIPAATASRTTQQSTDFGAWTPAQGSYYNYNVTSTTSSYTVQAVAIAGNCTLQITSLNVRTVSGTGCGFTSW